MPKRFILFLKNFLFYFPIFILLKLVLRSENILIFFLDFVWICKMPNISHDVKLDFKDVLLRPKRSQIRSRADVSFKFQYCQHEFKLIRSNVADASFKFNPV